jgi:N-acetylornithine carbamoyltransferase
MTLQGRHFLSTLEHPSAELRELAASALELKRRGFDRLGEPLRRRVLGTLFFNPSVRTRVSCEAAIARLGGSAITLHPGADTWRFEWGDGAVMDGATQEHVRELAPVLSRMCDVLGVRKAELMTAGAASAAAGASWAELSRDEFLHRFAERAEVPVVNLESNAFHPCQGLADMATLLERLGEPRGRKYVLSWAWHPKALPVATPHSQLLAACDLGMDVWLLRPTGYGLDPAVTEAARARAAGAGGGLSETEDVEAAFEGAAVVCAKSWGRLDAYGRPAEEARPAPELRERWIVDADRMDRTEEAFFMHCLPVRRNVIVRDEVLDSRRSAVVDEAEHRMWTAAALLLALLEGAAGKGGAA